MVENWLCSKCASLNPPRRNICWHCGSNRLMVDARSRSPETTQAALSATISSLDTDQPRLPVWLIRILTAAWPIELIFACILAASVAVVVWSDERNLVRLLGIAALGGAVAYIIGLVVISSRPFEWLASGNCEEALALLVLGIVVLTYYILVASICRHIILPIVFRIAGISDAQIPPVLGKKKSW
jgi:ribosomal protein L40E